MVRPTTHDVRAILAGGAELGWLLRMGANQTHSSEVRENLNFSETIDWLAGETKLRLEYAGGYDDQGYSAALDKGDIVRALSIAVGRGKAHRRTQARTTNTYNPALDCFEQPLEERIAALGQEVLLAHATRAQKEPTVYTSTTEQNKIIVLGYSGITHEVIGGLAKGKQPYADVNFEMYARVLTQFFGSMDFVPREIITEKRSEQSTPLQLSMFE